MKSKEKMTKKKKVTKKDSDVFGATCTCQRSDGICIGQFTINQVHAFQKDLVNRSKTEKKQWLIEQLRSRSKGKQKHVRYEVGGKVLCRHGFLSLFGLKKHHLDKARQVVDKGGGSLSVHGNKLSGVQANRGAMNTAIQGLARAEMAKETEEIQTGAMHVNCTFTAFIPRMREITDARWMENKLPQGDSRCREKPPSEDIIASAVKSMRTQYGQDIVWAQDNGKWFMCAVCLKQSKRRERGFSSDQDKQAFLKEVAAHSADHTNARAHKDFQAAMCEKYPLDYFMLLLDGTPGPTFPSFSGGTVPSELKGTHGIPLFWEVGKSYSTGEVYYALALKWWPKGANFLLEVKYHLLRAALSLPSSVDLKAFFDWWDGGSENRNFTNFAFLAKASHEMKLMIECARLWVGHTHNDGDALIKAPRRSFQASECKNIGDIIQALLRPSQHTALKPVVIFVHSIHDWTERANACKNKICDF